jgi:hypothetical protein
MLISEAIESRQQHSSSRPVKPLPMISIRTIFSLDDKCSRLYHTKPKIKVKYHKHKIFIPFTIIPDPANIEGFEFLSLPSALYEQEPVKVGYWSVNKKNGAPLQNRN